MRQSFIRPSANRTAEPCRRLLEAVAIVCTREKGSEKPVDSSHGVEKHTTINAGHGARTPLRPLKLETRLHKPNALCKAPLTDCSASVPPPETILARCVRRRPFYARSAFLHPPLEEAHRRQRQAVAAPPVALLRFDALCSHRQHGLAIACPPSSSIKLDVAMSNVSNHADKDKRLPRCTSPQSCGKLLFHMELYICLQTCILTVQLHRAVDSPQWTQP